MNFYLDTSVMVSLYVPEKHTAKVTEFTKNTEQLCISRLTEVEFYSALTIKVRTKQMSTTIAKQVTQLFSHHVVENTYEKIHITDTVFETAINFLVSYKTGLRTLDGLHLACCANTGATLVTADQTLARAAKSFGVKFQFL